MEDFKKLFEKVMQEEANRDAEIKKRTPEELKEMQALYVKEYDFKPGDIVCWKKDMKDAKFPAEGEPVVVLDVKPGQITEGNTGSNHELEPNDLRVGIFHRGTFGGFWYDKNRFEPYIAPESETSVQ